MAKYTVVAVNAGGAHSEELGTYDNVLDALKTAKKQKHADMMRLFGPKDYSLGENWTVEVQIDEDEIGNTYDRVGDAPVPLLYIRDIPTPDGRADCGGFARPVARRKKAGYDNKRVF